MLNLRKEVEKDAQRVDIEVYIFFRGSKYIAYPVTAIAEPFKKYALTSSAIEVLLQLYKNRSFCFSIDRKTG